jgi:hypothetical protein
VSAPAGWDADARPRPVEPVAALSLILSLVAPAATFGLSRLDGRGEVWMASLALAVVAPFGALVVGVMALSHIRRARRSAGIDGGAEPPSEVMLSRGAAWLAVLIAIVEILFLAWVALFAWMFAHSHLVF